jgi:hypothetical protein
LKLLKTDIVTDTISLAPEEMAQLEQFILRCVRAKREGSLLDMPLLGSSILKVISCFSQLEQMEEETIEPSSSSGSKKRVKRAANATQPAVNLETQIIPLSNDDIAFQTKASQQSKKGRTDRVDRRCPQPSQEEVDASFIFGRNFIFKVSMEKVRPPPLETTNQRILSAENARTVYLKL